MLVGKVEESDRWIMRAGQAQASGGCRVSGHAGGERACASGRGWASRRIRSLRRALVVRRRPFRRAHFQNFKISKVLKAASGKAALFRLACGGGKAKALE